MIDSRNKNEQAGQIATDFIDGEGYISSSPTARVNLVRLPLSAGLIFRKVFFFIEAILSPTTGDFLIAATIEFRKAGLTVSKLPASIAKDTDTLLDRSVACIAVGAASPVSDAIRVCLSKQFSGGYDNVILTPNRIATYADEVIMSLSELRPASGVTISSIRCYLAVMSSNERI